MLPGATVTILNTATGVARTTQTDETGRFRAPLLPVGTYEVIEAERTHQASTVGERAVANRTRCPMPRPWCRTARTTPGSRRTRSISIAEAFNLLDRDNINLQRSVFYNYDVARNLLIAQPNFGQDIGAADNRIVQLAVKLTF